METTKYKTFRMLLDFGGGMSRWLDVVAVSREAALADCKQGFTKFRLVTCREF